MNGTDERIWNLDRKSVNFDINEAGFVKVRRVNFPVASFCAGAGEVLHLASHIDVNDKISTIIQERVDKFNNNSQYGVYKTKPTEIEMFMSSVVDRTEERGITINGESEEMRKLSLTAAIAAAGATVGVGSSELAMYLKESFRAKPRTNFLKDRCVPKEEQDKKIALAREKRERKAREKLKNLALSEKGKERNV